MTQPFRSKSFDIEALQVKPNGENQNEFLRWANKHNLHMQTGKEYVYIEQEVHGYRAGSQADLDDWLVRWPDGTFQVINDETFTKMFETPQ